MAADATVACVAFTRLLAKYEQQPLGLAALCDVIYEWLSTDEDYAIQARSLRDHGLVAAFWRLLQSDTSPCELQTAVAWVLSVLVLGKLDFALGLARARRSSHSLCRPSSIIGPPFTFTLRVQSARSPSWSLITTTGCAH